MPTIDLPFMLHFRLQKKVFPMHRRRLGITTTKLFRRTKLFPLSPSIHYQQQPSFVLTEAEESNQYDRGGRDCGVGARLAHPTALPSVKKEKNQPPNVSFIFTMHSEDDRRKKHLS